MAVLTEHIARKARLCGNYPRCNHGIRVGQRYRRYVAFPGDEGHEHGTQPWVIEECAGCAGDSYRPITGATVQACRRDRGEMIPFATGRIIETKMRGSWIDTYVVLDELGKKHEMDRYDVIVLEAS